MTSIPTAPRADLTTDEAAALPADQVLEQVGSTAGGLSTAEAARRLARVGPNAVRTRHTSAWTILARQFRNAVPILLLITAVCRDRIPRARRPLCAGPFPRGLPPNPPYEFPRNGLSSDYSVGAEAVRSEWMET